MSSTSLVEIAYKTIRKDIINAQYMPGTLLSENELAAKLNMSRTPIRGAISRLESEGFVSSLSKRGILVKEISLKELIDSVEVLFFLQSYSIDAVIEKRCVFDLEELSSHLEKQIEAEVRDEYHEYVKYSILFTQSMVSSSKNNLMIKMYDSIKDKIIQMGIVNWKLTPTQKHYSANEIHQLIFEAIESREYEKVRSIIKEVYLVNRERMINFGSI
ncbi:GntR family transcriptional regulator [Bacillus sp. V2I10]|uniref:GntR family transcriptional regulator n=1 Tax=Bacillus sp. V2I10 TaxID=3042276 RepID=UPI0027810667|nr:GntR family transcriptional regulator [Bacillus sp. V2I10]MDQ0859863.1 DNA-binding GntR family transcriptional regulator [Bacillus sp. V2I10]